MDNEQKNIDSTDSKNQLLERFYEDLIDTNIAVDEVVKLVTDVENYSGTDETAAVMFDAAWWLIEHQHYGRALEILHQIAELDPDDLQSRLEIAKTHLRRGDQSEALQQFETAFHQALELQRYQICEQILTLMNRIDTDNPTISVLKGELLEHQDQPQKALEAFRQAAQQFEDEDHRQDFLSVAKRMLKLNPELDGLQKKVGEALIAESEAFLSYQLHAKTIRTLCEAIKHTPQQLKAYQLLARTLVQIDRVEDAIDIVVSATQRFEDRDSRDKLLKLARQLGADDDQLIVLEEQLVSATEQRDGDQPGDDQMAAPVFENSAHSLGTEKTNPEYSPAAFTDRARRREGPTIEGGSAVALLVEFLTMVDELDEPNRLIVQPSDGGPALECIVARGRLLPGLRIDDHAPDSDHDPEMNPRLPQPERTMVDQIWRRVTDPSAADVDPTSTVDGEYQRNALRHHTVQLLDLYRRQIGDVPVTIHLMETVNPPRSPISFSASSLLMEIGNHITSGSSSLLTEMYGGRRDPGTESWQFEQIDQYRRPLPIDYRGQRSSPSLSDILTATEIAEQLTATIPSLQQNETTLHQQPVGASLVFNDVAWGALWHRSTIWLTQIRPNQLGRLLRQLQTWTTEERQ